MALNSSQKRTLLALSLTLLITSCASSSNVSLKNSENADDYWYCAPGDQRTWRCAEDKEALGLSYYRFWKTTLDPEVEQFESEDVEQDADEPVMVQGAQVLPVEELSENTAAETVAGSSYEKEEVLVEEPLSPQAPTHEQSTQEGFEQTATETESVYGKVLQLAAHHSQSQAQSFADLLGEKLSQKPSVIQTRVNGQVYYTVVFEQLSSQQDVAQIITELAESFPTIQPWLRSRSGFEALRAD